jgi:hypothetical protein
MQFKRQPLFQLLCMQTAGMCDLNPLTRNVLASSNSELSFQLLALKLVVVVVGACLDSYFNLQKIIMLLAIASATALLIREAS